MKPDLPPLPDEVRALLDRAALPELPRGFEERLRARVGASLATSPQGHAGPSRAPWARGVTLPVHTLVAGACVALGTGLALGVAWGRFGWPPEPPPVVAAPPPPIVAPPASLPTGEPPRPPAEDTNAVRPPRPASKPAPAPTRVPLPAPAASGSEAQAPRRDTDLAAERALLELARAALGRGDVAGALSTIEQHERDYAHGRLEEEREVLAVQALVQAGRLGEAKQRQTAFRSRFPESLMLPVVDALLPTE